MDPRDLMYAMGGPVDAYQAIDAYRNGLRNIPEFGSMTRPEQSGFDRYTQMAQYGENFGPNANFGMRMLAIPGAIGGSALLGGNELSKLIPGMQNKIADWTGDSSFNTSENSSPASWSNFMSGMGGLAEGIAPGLFR